MCVRFFPPLVILLSINVVLVHNFLLGWGNSYFNTNDIKADVNSAENAVENAAASAAAEVEAGVDGTAAEIESGFSSFYGQMREKMQDIRGKIRDLFDMDSELDISRHINQLLSLAPEQLAVVQDMLGRWSEQARNHATDELELRRSYLSAAKNDLEGAMTSLSEGNYDTASEYFSSALRNVRDESAIYRALKYALYQDNTMLPLVSDLSHSLLNQLEYDLSDEHK